MFRKILFCGVLAASTTSALELVGVYMKPDLDDTADGCKAKNCYARSCKTAIDGVYELGKCTNVSGCMGGDDKTEVKSVAVVKEVESESTTGDVTSQVTNTEAWERL